MRISDWSSDVCSSDLKRAAEEIANREKCDDFEEFRPLFEGIEADLKGGLRQAKPLGNSEVTLAEIQPGNFFIVGGQLAYVAASTDAFTTQYERADRSEEHTSELQSLMRISYAVFCLKKQRNKYNIQQKNSDHP